MGFTEYLLLIVVVIGIPLVVAGAVTLWSLKQARYRPKKRRPRSDRSELEGSGTPAMSGDRSEGPSS